MYYSSTRTPHIHTYMYCTPVPGTSKIDNYIIIPHFSHTCIHVCMYGRMYVWCMYVCAHTHSGTCMCTYMYTWHTGTTCTGSTCVCMSMCTWSLLIYQLPVHVMYVQLDVCIHVMYVPVPVYVCVHMTFIHSCMLHVHYLSVLGKSNSNQTASNATIKSSIIASVCSGLGVKRNRSVPRATVGKLIGWQ